MSTNVPVLVPTFTGYVSSTRDALILFEACLRGQLSHVARRPHDRERNELIASGNVFIYEENASGIKRWTDGVTWSPSRILGNFLIYRELDKPFPPGEKKRAMKKQNRRQPYPMSRNDHNGGTYSPTNTTSGMGSERANNDERALIGSLVDSYGFKSDGLVKKTMSVTVSGVTHHLVSYYKCNKVQDGSLETPQERPELAGIEPRNELQAKQNFRVPTSEETGAEETYVDHGREGYNPQYLYSNPMMGSSYMNPSAPRIYVPSHSFTTMPQPSNTANTQFGVTAPGGSQTYFANTEAMNSYGHGSYSRNFDNMSTHGLPTPMTSSVASLATSQPDQSDDKSSVLYPPQNIRSRSIMNQSPLHVGHQGSNSYSMATAGPAGRMDTRPSLQPSPTQLTAPSRDPAVGRTMYTHDRGPQFYPNGAATTLSTQHPQHHPFSTSTHMSSWPGSGMAPTSQHLQ